MTISTNIQLLRPVFITLQRAIYPVRAVRIFHFQDGGDVTNPAGLSPCILPWKFKSGPMPPSRAKNLARKVGKSRAIPLYDPRVNPPGWLLISALIFISKIKPLVNMVKMPVVISWRMLVIDLWE